MVKIPEPRKDQIAHEALMVFLQDKLEPDAYEKANYMINELLIAISGVSYQNGMKAALKKK